MEYKWPCIWNQLFSSNKSFRSLFHFFESYFCPWLKNRKCSYRFIWRLSHIVCTHKVLHKWYYNLVLIINSAMLVTILWELRQDYLLLLQQTAKKGTASPPSSSMSHRGRGSYICQHQGQGQLSQNCRRWLV